MSGHKLSAAQLEAMRQGRERARRARLEAANAGDIERATADALRGQQVSPSPVVILTESDILDAALAGMDKNDERGGSGVARSYFGLALRDLVTKKRREARSNGR